MLDVGKLSVDVHTEFEVPITVQRDGDPDREEVAVLHLDAEIWSPTPGIDVYARHDALSVRESVDLADGDIVTCSDTSAVPSPTSWRITDRRPQDDDEWIRTWLMKKILP